jgi:hypothetical protein
MNTNPILWLQAYIIGVLVFPHQRHRHHRASGVVYLDWKLHRRVHPLTPKDASQRGEVQWRIMNQPMTAKSAWQAEVAKMRNVYKALVSQKDVPDIVTYLTAIKARNREFITAVQNVYQ